MISIKLHKTYRDVVAICDSELIGERFEEDKFQLDIKESFFKGDEVSEEKAKEIMTNFSCEDSTFNIVGEKAIQCALEAGIISKKGIKKIQGVPFALVLL